jgi:hypothetical protein
MSGTATPVSESNGSQMQSVLERFYADLLGELGETVSDWQGIGQDKSNNHMEVWSQGQLVFGKSNDGKEIATLDPKLEGRLEVAQQLPPGSQIKGLEEVTVLAFNPASGQAETVFATDSQGKIEENISSKTAAPIKGSERLQERLELLNSAEGKMLTRMVKQLTEEVRQQRGLIREQQEINQKLRSVKAKLIDSLKQQDSLLERRIESKDPTWWQKAAQRFQEFREIYRQRRQQQDAAYTLIKLWDKETRKQDGIYQGTNYTIRRKGSEFEVRDQENKVVLEFIRTPVKGVIIRNYELSSQDFAEIVELKKALQQNEFKGGFVSLETELKNRNKATTKVTSELVQLARQQSQGKFVKEGAAYNLYAEASGEVKIWRKQGETPELIYERSAQNQINRLNNQDISVLTKALLEMKQRQLQRNQAPAPVAKTTIAVLNKGKGR